MIGAVDGSDKLIIVLPRILLHIIVSTRVFI